MISVGPMPCPVLRYHGPAGSMPACSQSLSSFAWVPDSSARDANSALDSAIACSACAVSPAPATPAGSPGGPTSTKSLCMTDSRVKPRPSSMNACSASGECTSSTSAWPRAPRSIACPEPTATVLTLHDPVRSKAGTNVSSRPVSCVLVVVARIIRPPGAGVPPPALSAESDPQPASATSTAAANQRSPHFALLCAPLSLRS